MPLLLLALVGLPFVTNIRIPAALPISLATAALVLYVAGLILSYQVTCVRSSISLAYAINPNIKTGRLKQVLPHPSRRHEHSHRKSCLPVMG